MHVEKSREKVRKYCILRRYSKLSSAPLKENRFSKRKRKVRNQPGFWSKPDCRPIEKEPFISNYM